MLRTELIRPLSELLARHAAERGDRPAFSDERLTVGWGELERRTARLATHLSARVGQLLETPRESGVSA